MLVPLNIRCRTRTYHKKGPMILGTTHVLFLTSVSCGTFVMLGESTVECRVQAPSLLMSRTFPSRAILAIQHVER